MRDRDFTPEEQYDTGCDEVCGDRKRGGREERGEGEKKKEKEEKEEKGERGERNGFLDGFGFDEVGEVGRRERKEKGKRER